MAALFSHVIKVCILWMVFSQVHRGNGRSLPSRITWEERRARKEDLKMTRLHQRQNSGNNGNIVEMRKKKKQLEVTVTIRKMHGRGDLMVEVGSDVELTCEVNHLPRGCEMRWLFLAQNEDQVQVLSNEGATTKIGEYNIRKRKGRYLILSMPFADENVNGTYICDVIHEQQTTKDDRIRLIVKEPHAYMATKKVGQLGQLAEFVCNYDGVKPWLSVEWTRKTTKFITKETQSPGMSTRMTDQYIFWSKVVTEFYNGSAETYSHDNSIARRVKHVKRKHADGSTTFHLIVRDLDCSDNGTFRCNVIHERGSSPANSRLILVAPPSKPTITSSPQNPVTAGQMIVLTCKGNVGIPAGVLTWYQQLLGRPIQKLNVGESSVSGTGDCMYAAEASILVTASRDEHHAVYSCFSSRKGSRPTMSSAFARYTIIIGGEDITPQISISPLDIIPRNAEVTIRCSLPSNTHNAVIALYSVLDKVKRQNKSQLTEDMGNLIAYTDRRGTPVLVDAAKHKGRLKVAGSKGHLELVITKAGCVDACAYRCAATRFSEPIYVSVVDFTKAVSMTTSTRCSELIDDDVDCRECPFVARTGQEFPVTCTGQVAFPDVVSHNRFSWSVVTSRQKDYSPVSKTSSILGANPGSDVKFSVSGCFSEYKTSLFIYRPSLGDANTVTIGCELKFVSNGLRHTRRAEITVCVRKGFTVAGSLKTTTTTLAVFVSSLVASLVYTSLLT